MSIYNNLSVGKNEATVRWCLERLGAARQTKQTLMIVQNPAVVYTAVSVKRRVA